jgi:hypothetical protein
VNDYEEQQMAEKCKAEWARDQALRAEFLTLDAYIAYCKAMAKGLVKVLGRDT